MKIDMTNHDALVKVFEEIEKKYDPIHVLVNNAGVYPPASILTGSTEQMRKIMDTNVIALCIATREGIRIMRNNGVEGYVININSVAGHIVPPVSELDIYSASKFAVTAICESTRKELVREGSKIRVTVRPTIKFLLYTAKVISGIFKEAFQSEQNFPDKEGTVYIKFELDYSTGNYNSSIISLICFSSSICLLKNVLKIFQ